MVFSSSVGKDSSNNNNTHLTKPPTANIILSTLLNAFAESTKNKATTKEFDVIIIRIDELYTQINACDEREWGSERTSQREQNKEQQKNMRSANTLQQIKVRMLKADDQLIAVMYFLSFNSFSQCNAMLPKQKTTSLLWLIVLIIEIRFENLALIRLKVYLLLELSGNH